MYHKISYYQTNIDNIASQKITIRNTLNSAKIAVISFFEIKPIYLFRTLRWLTYDITSAKANKQQRGLQHLYR